MLGVLSAMYDFPNTLADTARGEQQYDEISRAVQNNDQVRQLIIQLEAEYDSVQTGPELESLEDPTLSPEMEQFLDEMAQRLEEGPSESSQN